MRIVHILAALTLTACGAAESETNRLPKVDRLCMGLPGTKAVVKASTAGKQFFPTSFGQPAQVCDFKGYPECFPIVSEHKNEWYSEHWDAANEPSLFESSIATTSAQGSTLRFTWLPTDHPAVIVRIERTEKSASLFAKQLSGKGGYEPGRVARQITRPLLPNEIAALDTIINETRVLEQRATDCDLGLDGSLWIVEWVQNSDYRFFERWTPQSGPVRRLGDFALDLTGWTFEERY